MTAAIDRIMNAQVIYWKKQKEQLDEPEKVNHLPFVTISREYGCGGYEVAAKLSEILNEELKPEPLWAPYNKKLLDKLMIDTGLSESLVETLTGRARSKLTNLIQTTFSSFPPQVAVHKKLVEIMAMLAMNGHVVLVGRGGNMITKDMEGGFHVRLYAPIQSRAEKMAEILNVSTGAAMKTIKEKTKLREEYMKEFFKIDISDPHNYDLAINDSTFTVEQVARIIINGMKSKGVLIEPEE
ncbi:MAG TPA: cytidylate kinase-like family protein [Spirochaetota bacterium]|nr:cytidylate kinase-like family protein [Spirochaetota bacterium]HPJ34134.1 cytidylate kinase-like family protein [Spirochaetota bacterium]